MMTCRIPVAALAAALTLSCQALAAEPADQPARPSCVIVLGERAADPEKFAAEFLAARIRRDLASQASIAAAAPAGGQATALILGTPESNPALAKFKGDLPKNADGFLITTDGGATVLVGGSPRAVIYAVARWMQERGWRFYSLHDLGEIPLDPQAPEPKLPIKDAPVFDNRFLSTDSLGNVAPRYFDWMALNGLNHLKVFCDKVGVEAAVSISKELSRRGIELNLECTEAWLKAQAELKGNEKPEDAAAKMEEARKRIAGRVPGAGEVVVSDWARLGFRPWAEPGIGLDENILELSRKVYGGKAIGTSFTPHNFFLDDEFLVANYFAFCAWKGPQPLDDFTREFSRRYYGKDAADDVTAYFLGIKNMQPQFTKPDALLDDATYASWKALAGKFSDARQKLERNSIPRRRLVMQLAALNEDYLARADAARALKKAENSAGDERRKFLLEAIRISWDANRRKGPRLFEANPGDLYGFRAADGRSPELEGELALLEKARALVLAGDDQKLAPGLVAQALAPEAGGKLAAEPLASDVGGNKPELFADGKPDTATFLAPGPAGRFVIDFGKEVTVSRVRFLANPERPISGFRLRAADASGAVSTLVQGSASGPEIFLVQNLAFPATKARKLILEVERYEPVRSDRLGPALAEIEAYEK